MKLTDDKDERRLSPQLITAIVVVSLFLFCILTLVLILNRKQINDQIVNQTNNYLNQLEYAGENGTQTSHVSTQSAQQGVGDSTISSPDDLDFWGKYPVGGDSSGSKNTSDGDSYVSTGSNLASDNLTSDANSDSNAGLPAEEEVGLENDGKHTKVILRDGSEEWVVISPYLPKHNYDVTQLVLKSQFMEYYNEGVKTSFVGIDVSKYQDYIDFNKVRKAGIEFVMLRAGGRGYGTGQMTEDDYFSENLKRATDAGLRIGVTFSSQAISVEEAQEEAAFILEMIGDYRIDYPIVFDMSYPANDVSRIETITKSQRTEVAKAFLEMISQAGYTGMMKGNKEWLIKEIDMSKLTAYDFWLDQEGELFDFPYQFSMWNYSKKGTVDGIAGLVNLDISFIDYAEK